LAENFEFATACEQRGLTFIGPPARAIRDMGHKISAREIMQRAGVPVVPGGDAATLDAAKHSADAIGYPIMLKPAAGGGGKGMRRIESPADLEKDWLLAKQEAERAFSDSTMYLEKYLENPRHVEVQVVGDQHGNLVHLFERDCSLQRRHQKVVEEAPCAALPLTLARAMGETSVQGAKALGYFSAGTFEYLLDQDGNFYFLEMNTRLQVEHGVTELITGVDLVELMLAVAKGEALGFEQDDVVRRGHAIECRIYAEDPERGFLPSPGRILRLVLPEGPGIRNDAGAESGDDVSGFYDPLIAKLLVWGKDRNQCLSRVRRALAEYVVEGPKTNLELLRRLMAHPYFSRGEVDTSFIQKHELSRSAPVALAPDELYRVAAAAALLSDGEPASSGELGLPANTLSEWVRQHRSSWK